MRRLSDVACNHCNQTNTLTATSQDNYFHVFWLPLFTIGTSRYAACSHCKRGYCSEEFTEEMQRALD
ncbi:MAG: zinc-ribbon domain-containing protein [Bacteroidota bacterium]